MFNRVTVTTPPGASDLAVTLAEAKAWLDVEYDTDDTMITEMVAAATAKLDGPNGIGIACFTQSWTLTLDRFSSDVIELPGWPVKSVASIKYLDTDGVQQTLGSSNYELHLKRDQAHVRPVYNGNWPTARDIQDSIEIEYVVGEAADDINPQLKLAIKMMVAHWYHQREAFSSENYMEVPMASNQIMRDFMRGGITA